MNQNKDNNDTKRIEYLMSNLFAGIITDSDEKKLAEMLEETPENKELYFYMAKTRAVSFIPALEKDKKHQYNKLINTIIKDAAIKPNNFFLKNFLRVAVILMLVVSTIGVSYNTLLKYGYLKTTAYTETIVPMGSYTKIILPDGTVAILNSGSTLKYDANYGRKTRSVTLSGEGYFEVTRDTGKPFLVNILDIEVKVLGTVFNVRSYLDDPNVEVNLIEGKVNIANKKDLTSEVLSLVPNEKMIYSKVDGNMSITKAECYKSAQWTVGKLYFENTSFEKITKDLERKFDVKIEIRCDNIKSELFTGVLDLNQSLSSILDYLDVDKKLKKTYQGKLVTISKRS